jgi:hypothetical protein
MRQGNANDLFNIDIDMKIYIAQQIQCINYRCRDRGAGLELLMMLRYRASPGAIL